MMHCLDKGVTQLREWHQTNMEQWWNHKQQTRASENMQFCATSLTANLISNLQLKTQLYSENSESNCLS